MYKLFEAVEVNIVRAEADFDRACDSAMRYATDIFGVDEAGHITNVEGAERSSAAIVLTFLKYVATGGMFGWSHEYRFTAQVEQEPDEEDEPDEDHD